MKKRTFHLACGLSLLLLTSCAGWSQDKPHKSRNSTSITITNHKNGKDVTTIIIKDKGVSLEMKYMGDIKFNEEETAVVSISPKGFVKYEKDDYKIFVENNEKGELVHEFYVKGKQQPFEAEAKKVLQEAIAEMLAHGLGAADRAERIFKKSGIDGLLSEVPRLKNDYVKSVYLEYALEKGNLSEDKMTTIAQNIGKLLDSDFEKAKLLKQFAATYLKNPATAQAYLSAVETIDSDFEKSNALKHILKNTLPDATFLQAVQVTKSIDSDFEKVNVLKSAFENNQLSGDRFSATLQCVGSINSDFEKANVLKYILKGGNMPENQFNETLEVVKSIHSDFEKANVLKSLLTRYILQVGNFTKLLEVVGSIDSDFEKANVLKNIIENTLQKEEQWIAVIEAATKIDSDFEKANVLLKIAPKINQSEKAKAAYTKAAKTIDSDWEYGKVTRALD